MMSFVLLLAWAFGDFVYFAENPDDLKPIWEFELYDGRHIYCLDYQVRPCGITPGNCEMGGSPWCDLATVIVGEIDPD